MRILFVLALLLAAACGSKKAPQSPAASGTEATEQEKESEMRDEKKPDDPDEMPKDGADPCDGGE